MDVTAWAIALMEILGGPGTALVIASEALFPPIPGEVLLPFAGVTAAANGQHVLVPIVWTTLGSVLGGLGVYAVGRALGLRRTKALVRRLPLLEEHYYGRLTRAEVHERFGLAALRRKIGRA